MTEKKLDIKNPNEVYYRPLGEEAYSDKSFIEGFSQLGGLEEALVTIKEDPQNTQAIKLAGGVLFGNENWYYGTNTSPRPALEEASSEGRKGLEKYLSKNESTVLEKLGPEEYRHLIATVPLAKLKDDGEHKTIVDVANEFKAVQEGAKDVSKMREYVSGKIKSAPKYVQTEFARSASNEVFIRQMFANYAAYAQNNLREVLEKGDCEGAFKASLNVAKKKGEYYNAIANQLYQKLTKKEE